MRLSECEVSRKDSGRLAGLNNGRLSCVTESTVSSSSRVRWRAFDSWEGERLKEKLLGDWEQLDFLKNFWNLVYDRRDIEQYVLMAKSWQLRRDGLLFKEIGRSLGVDPGKACAYEMGLNCRPVIAQLYLNYLRIGKAPEGWKWILDSTPKPTNQYPRALQVPEHISGYEDILEFLSQFSPVAEGSETLRFFGLTSEWVELHKPDLFWFLLGFLVGDGGKYYSDSARNTRHYRKTSMSTRMAETDSNYRVLLYVQLALESMGIESFRVKSENGVIRWNSEATNLLTWMLQVCIGLQEGQRTSYDPVVMPWLLSCPKHLVVAFLQGLADSDGNVEKHGYHANISSIPNSTFFKQLFDVIGTKSRLHPKRKPQQVRILLQPAMSLPLFNPIIRSYRYMQVIRHSIRRQLYSPNNVRTTA